MKLRPKTQISTMASLQAATVANNLNGQIIDPASRNFSLVETKHLLKLMATEKITAMFNSNKPHATIWAYIHACMLARFPKFSKTPKQCCKK